MQAAAEWAGSLMGRALRALQKIGACNCFLDHRRRPCGGNGWRLSAAHSVRRGNWRFTALAVRRSIQAPRPTRAAGRKGAGYNP
jgi:hypothetical protein